MLKVKRPSKWKYDTSSGVSVSASFVVSFGAGKGSLFLVDPDGNAVELHYVSAGAGAGFGAKLPGGGKLPVGGTTSETQYLSAGRIAVLEPCKGDELAQDDMTGMCMCIEASGGLIQGGAATVMLLGIEGDQDALSALKNAIEGTLVPGIGFLKKWSNLADHAKALLIMGGLNTGVQAGASIINSAGYVWSGATPDGKIEAPRGHHVVNIALRKTNTSQDITYRLAGDVLFDFAEDTIGTKQNPAEALRILKQVGEDIKKKANRIKGVHIEGHTDSIGDDRYNQGLSERRAKRVANWLITNRYVGAANVSTDGWGKKKPVASNLNAQGRAQNRRVEIILRLP